MIRQFTIPVVIVCFLLGACSISTDKKQIPEGYSKLTVVVDDSSRFYLDRILVKDHSTQIKLFKNYDTIRRKLVYIYDSLRNNQYEITLASLLNRDLKFKLTLVKDTTIIIDKSDLKNFDAVSNASNLLSDLQNTDTLCIAYESIGCFHNYSNKTLIYKTPNGFVAEFKTDTSHDGRTSEIISIKRQLPISFADTLRKLEVSCMKGFSEQLKIRLHCDRKLSKAKDAMDSLRATMALYSSTTSSTIYFNKGNKVFELTSNGINEIPYYYGFMKALKLE